MSITNDQRKMIVDGLLNDVLSLNDVAKLTGLSYETLRKSWNEEVLGGKAIAKMKLQADMDSATSVRKVTRQSSRYYFDMNTLAERLMENGRERYPNLGNRNELFECECYSESFVVVLSDLHIGQEYDNNVGRYNLDVAKERLEHMGDQILLKTDDYDVIHLFLLGDLIENLHLHKSTALEVRMDTVKQIEACTDLLSDFIYRLYENGLSVNVYSCGGNHDRLAPKEETLRNERFSELITWILSKEFKHIDQIEFCTNKESTMIDTEIEGCRVIGVHGDFDKNHNKLIQYCGGNVDIILCGHYHSFGMEQNNNTIVVKNGALCGSGADYCVKGRMMGRPEQTILKIRHGIGVYEITPVWF